MSTRIGVLLGSKITDIAYALCRFVSDQLDVSTIMSLIVFHSLFSLTVDRLSWKHIVIQYAYR